MIREEPYLSVNPEASGTDDLIILREKASGGTITNWIITTIVTMLLTSLARGLYGIWESEKDRNVLYKEADRSKGDFTKHVHYRHSVSMIKALRKDDKNGHLKRNLKACEKILEHLASNEGRATYMKAHTLHKKWFKKAPVINWFNYQTMCVVLFMAIHEMTVKAVEYDEDFSGEHIIKRINAVSAREISNSVWNERALNIEKFLIKNERRIIFSGELHKISAELGDPVNEDFGFIGDMVIKIGSALAVAAFVVWMARNVAYYCYKARHNFHELISTQRKYLEIHMLSVKNERAREKQKEYVEYMKRAEKVFEIEENDVHKESQRQIEQEDREIFKRAKSREEGSNTPVSGELA